MELKDYDPYRAIGGASEFAKSAARTRKEAAEDWRPVMDAFHADGDLVLRYEIPGVRPEDVQVQVDGRVLYVRGRRRPPETMPPPELTMRAERTYGSFDRSIALPAGTDPAGVRATYLHGLLEVRVAHVRRPEPTEVDLKVIEAGPASIAVLGT